MTYKAHVQDDFIRQWVRLRVADINDNRTVVLMPNGVWESVPPGATLPDLAGIELPIEALPAVAEAIAKFLGKELPSVAEVSVLREWLAVERGRVDKVLDR